ncbi:hypothetical protein Hypma_003087 [Hypsizygus marmoreus]|uniref:Uncharacterized protein n=1 Tax=Hypsizygus marmoreus TaxID=39966 RepID=A0A369J6S2_HYPMA|nr:hypothetical protein Hypma_003087 [Hypsizygus marmoreus]
MLEFSNRDLHLQYDIENDVSADKATCSPMLDVSLEEQIQAPQHTARMAIGMSLCSHHYRGTNDLPASDPTVS